MTSRAGAVGLNSWVIRVCDVAALEPVSVQTVHVEATHTVNSSRCVSVTTLSSVGTIADTGI